MSTSLRPAVPTQRAVVVVEPRQRGIGGELVHPWGRVLLRAVERACPEPQRRRRIRVLRGPVEPLQGDVTVCPAGGSQLSVDGDRRPVVQLDLGLHRGPQPIEQRAHRGVCFDGGEEPNWHHADITGAPPRSPGRPCRRMLRRVSPWARGRDNASSNPRGLPAVGSRGAVGQDLYQLVAHFYLSLLDSGENCLQDGAGPLRSAWGASVDGISWVWGFQWGSLC